MNRIQALAIKLLATLVLLYIVLDLFYNMSFRNVFLISVVLGISSYLIGDLLILPRTNNMISTFADFGWAFLVIWIMGDYITIGNEILTAAFISSAGLAFFESLFHNYLIEGTETHTVRETNFQPKSLQYQFESSEELTPNKKDVNSNKDEN